MATCSPSGACATRFCSASSERTASLVAAMSAPSASSRGSPHIRLNSGRGGLPAQSSFANRLPGAAQDAGGRSLIPSRPATPSPLRINAPRPGAYGESLDSPGPPSTENLLHPPSKSRTHRFRDQDSPRSRSPLASEFSSRRTSWSSEGGSREREGRSYTPNPFADSRAPSRTDSDDENINTQTVSERYNILPSAGLLLFPEDVEKDDYLHNPGPNDNEKKCDVFNKRGICNMGGLIFITLGILFLFIGYPAL